ncbi:hypothetical protein EST38_g4376 [Candolleomyces aberdarensis]|uniref:Folylpolyglutamate synthase n=1 Tax=Candolleomyces aberdarensis TaxID=2316362 RepID=A0A4Q2DMS0_9AGAR|nr:hypothetical protein EST38_g4376 [Candolleomyces aberdarensis]
MVLRSDQEHRTKLSPFEILTLTALQLFEQAGVDVVVMEVGMGGRLDATNVIDTECILISGLTAVDLDHQAFLGNTVGAIATEKAGIARQDKPFVVGPQSRSNQDAVTQAVKRRVEEVGAQLCEPVKVEKAEMEAPFVFRDPGEFRPPKGTTIQASIPLLSSTPIRAVLPLHGAHQLDNLSTALGIVQALLSLDDPRLDLRKLITLEAVQKGIENVQWRGRLSWHEYSDLGRRIPVLVDGAHNLASSLTLRTYIDSLLSPSLTNRKRLHFTYILALSHSPPKKPKDTLEPLFTLTSDPTSSPPFSMSAAFVTFTPPTDMPWVRPVPPTDLALSVREILSSESAPPTWTPSRDVHLGEGDKNVYLKEALDWAAKFHDHGSLEDTDDVQQLIVVAGSLYLVADFYRLFDGFSTIAS